MKRFRSSVSHPDGIKKTAWPTLLVPNSVCLDEVGAGAWMGPLTVGAVYLLPGFDLPGIHDSKLLNQHEREKLYEELKFNERVIYHVEHISNKELDDLGGLVNAWPEAMKRAVLKLSATLASKNLPIDLVILDGNKSFDCEFPLKLEVKADSKYIGVAAASIMAKVERDRMMESLASQYPQFEKIMRDGKGYSSGPNHGCLIRQGIYTDLHRKTYNPLKSFLLQEK